MPKKLTRPQLKALRAINQHGPVQYLNNLNVRHDVGWRLVRRGLVKSIGAWSITRAGREILLHYGE